MYSPAPSPTLSAEDRVISIIRTLLPLSALLIMLIDPARPAATQVEILVVLVLVSSYGLLLDFMREKSQPIERFAMVQAHWVDVAWCAALIAISGRVNSIFFLGFLFPITVSSVRWGFVTGMRVTITSAVSYAAISLMPFLAGQPDPQMNKLLMKSIWLLTLGYLMAHWGESRIIVRRRFEFLEHVRHYSNPRFGIARTVGSVLQHLKSHYGAQSCVMIFNNLDGEGYRYQRTDDGNPELAMQVEPIAPELALRLLEMPFDTAAVYNARPEGLWPFGRVSQALDLTFNRVANVPYSTLSAVATVLGTDYFLTAPVHHRGQNVGRLYILAQRAVFIPSDMLFLHQIVTDFGPVMENIILVEQLATHAADDERRRIAHDIHDSVIQPYIGLQMGLAALLKKTGGHFPDLAKQIESLMDMTQTGINDLRRFVTGLREADGSDGGLVPAMRRFAAKFSDATGIAVKIETDGDIRANARLASEAFQMTAEGLSNIRKHTQAASATVRLACRLGHLILEIAEEGSRRMPAAAFAPDSLTERAVLLGGKVRVKSTPEGGTAVVIDIPL